MSLGGPSSRSLDNVFTSRWASVAVDSHAPAGMLSRLWSEAEARQEAAADAGFALGPLINRNVASQLQMVASREGTIPPWSVDSIEIQFSFEPVFQGLTPRNVPALQQAYVSVTAWLGGMRAVGEQEDLPMTATATRAASRRTIAG